MSTLLRHCGGRIAAGLRTNSGTLLESDLYRLLMQMAVENSARPLQH
jgi:hypothetical protein